MKIIRFLLWSSLFANASLLAVLLVTQRQSRLPARHAVNINDPMAVKAYLEAAGLKSPVIVAALKATLIERDESKDPSGSGNTSRWRPIVRHPPDVIEIESGLARAHEAELRGLIADLPDVLGSGKLGDGLVPRDKLTDVQAIEDSFTPGPSLTSDYNKKIVAVLGKTTGEAFLRLRSPEARLIQHWLRKATVPQAVYDSLVADAFEATGSLKTVQSGAPLGPRIDGLVQKVRERLGNSTFLRIAPNLDPLSGSVDHLVTERLTPDERVALFFRIHETLGNIRSKTALAAADDARGTYDVISRSLNQDASSQHEFEASNLGRILKHATLAVR